MVGVLQARLALMGPREADQPLAAAELAAAGKRLAAPQEAGLQRLAQQEGQACKG